MSARAVKVRDLDPSSTGASRVLWLAGEGDDAHCVVTSAIVAYSGPETLVFASDKDGDVTDWMDLPGSFRGDLDHDRAIAGYVDRLNGVEVGIPEWSTSELIGRIFGGES